MQRRYQLHWVSDRLDEIAPVNAFIFECAVDDFSYRTHYTLYIVDPD